MTYLFTNLFIDCDSPRPWGLYFQDSASPQMEALVELHDNIMFYLVIVLFGVAWVLVSVIRNYVNDKFFISNKYLNHGTPIKLIWTIAPALILILIAFPSFKLLCLMGEVTDSSLTVFAEWDQWYKFDYGLHCNDGGGFEDWLGREVDIIFRERLNDVNDINTKITITVHDLKTNWIQQALNLSRYNPTADPYMVKNFDYYMSRSINKCDTTDPTFSTFLDRFYNSRYAKTSLAVYKYYKNSSTGDSTILNILMANKLN